MRYLNMSLTRVLSNSWEKNRDVAKMIDLQEY